MVAVIDYRMGNTRSVVKTLKAIGYDAVLTNDRQKLRDASHLILPGVGAFPDGMKNLHELGLVEIMNEEVVEKGKPFLAICIGIQLLGDEGMEHGGPHPGLGWIRGRVEPFTIDEKKYKVPHVGWNNISIVGDPLLFQDVHRPDPDFYFVHSFHLKATDPKDVIATCEYGETFVAAVQKNNIMGVQFHPEKSQKNGVQLLKNFMSLS
jgi:glutamine amidotransferase